MSDTTDPSDRRHAIQMTAPYFSITAVHLLTSIYNDSSITWPQKFLRKFHTFWSRRRWAVGVIWSTPSLITILSLSFVHSCPLKFQSVFCILFPYLIWNFDENSLKFLTKHLRKEWWIFLRHWWDVESFWQNRGRQNVHQKVQLWLCKFRPRLRWSFRQKFRHWPPVAIFSIIV